MTIIISKSLLLERARELRRNNTDTEKILWRCLRNRQLQSCKFKRQKPIGPYIVDFICNEVKLIIELDGGQHSFQNHYDEKRSGYLNSLGFTVFRYWNNEVLGFLEDVLDELFLEIEKRKSAFYSNPSPCPSPRGGEGTCGQNQLVKKY